LIFGLDWFLFNLINFDVARNRKEVGFVITFKSQLLNIWHLKNTNYAIRYPTPFDSLTAPVLNVWTDINDSFGSLYNIVLRQK